MTDHMIFVREQGQVEYDIIYAPEVIYLEDGTQQPFQIEQLHAMIRDTLGRNEEIIKISCEEITVRNNHGLRFMFKKTEPKLEVVFEGPPVTPSSTVSACQSSYYPPVLPVSVPPSSGPSDNKWLTVLENNPMSFGQSGTTINEHLLVFGGFVNEETSNACLLLSDTRGGRFSKLTVRGDIPPARERHSASLIGKRIYIFGGYNRNGEVYYSTLYSLESETLTWALINPHGFPPEKRCGHSASVVDGKLWVFGGRVKVKKSGILDHEGTGVQYRNDLHCYDPVTNEWYRYEPRGVGPSGRALHSAVVVSRKIYIFGGANSSGSRNDSSGFCDLYELDIDTMSWTECETHSTPPTPCYGHTGTYIGDDKILFFGGKGYQVHNQIHILDLKTMTWQQQAYAGNPLSPRWGHCATLHDTRVLIYGGRCDIGYYSSIETIDYTTQLIELKPEEQAKEKLKRKLEEKNRSREAIGNLQTTLNSLQTAIQQMGEQLLAQKKTLNETRHALLSIKKENDVIKSKVAQVRASRNSTINLSSYPLESL